MDSLDSSETAESLLGDYTAEMAGGQVASQIALRDAETPSEDAPISEETLRAKTEMAWQLFKSLENQVQAADRKVQAIFGANTLLVAAVSFQDQDSLGSLHRGQITLSAAVELTLRLLLLASICVSSLSAIVALFPRLRGAGTAQARSLLFFGDIVTLPAPQFVAEFLETSPSEKVRQLLRQSYSVSVVVSEKFRWTHRAGIALVTSLLLWIIVELIKILSGR